MPYRSPTSPLVLLFLVVFLCTGCYTTKTGKLVRVDTRDETRTIERTEQEFRIVETPTPDNPVALIEVAQKPIYRVETVNMHRKMRKHNNRASLSLFGGGLGLGVTYLALIPGCSIDDERECTPTENLERSKYKTLGRVSLGMMGAGLLIRAFLEADSTYTATNNLVEGRKGLTRVAGDSGPIGYAKVTLSINEKRRTYTADADGRIRVDLVQDFGLGAFDRPAPVVVAGSVPTLDFSSTFSLDPRLWTAPFFRADRALTLLDRPSTSRSRGGQVGRLDAGVEYRIQDQRDGWVKMSVAGTSGWVKLSEGQQFWALPTRIDPSRLPSLSREVDFREPSGNRRIDGDESGAVVVTVTNHGAGPAYRVNASVSPSADPLLQYPSSLEFGDIASGQAVEKTLPIRAKRDIQSGNRMIRLTFREANGFEPEPVQVTFETEAFVPPNLQIVEVGVQDSDEDGRIKPGELSTITVRIQNNSRRTAEKVQAQVNITGKDIIRVSDASYSFSIGSLGPGETHDISFPIVPNQRAEELPVEVSLTEAYGTFGRDIPLDLKLDTPTRPISELNVEGQDTPISTGTPAPIVSETERDLPETRMSNPNAVAVVVGIRDYLSTDIPSVEYARRDAQLMRRYLVEVLGYDKRNILPSDPDQVITAGKLKTLVREELRNFVRNDGTTDVFVYFSGHGVPAAETGDAYLVPADADPNFVTTDNAYKLDTFYKDLIALNSRTLTLVIDACFSGQSGDGSRLIREASNLELVAEDPLFAAKDTYAFRASGSRQVANWYSEKRHGLFTYFFLLGLKGRADQNEDGVVTVGEMERYLTDEDDGVPRYALRLHNRPQMPEVTANNLEHVLVRYR